MAAPAQISLGLRYADGHGVPKDYAEVVKWFDIAAELGNAAAATYRDALLGLLDANEAAKAQRLARLWLLQNRR